MIKVGSGVFFRLALSGDPSEDMVIRGAVVKLREHSATLVTKPLSPGSAMFEMNDGKRNIEYIFMSVAHSKLTAAHPIKTLGEEELLYLQKTLAKLEPI